MADKYTGSALRNEAIEAIARSDRPRWKQRIGY
jgi:hypothetical protein